MVIALEHLLEPGTFATRAHPDPRRRPGARGQVRGHQPRAGEEIPAAPGRIEPQGEHGGRCQTAARVWGRAQMQAQRPPAGDRIIAHHLERTLGRARDESQPRSTGLDDRSGGDLRHEHHVQHPLAPGPQRPAPLGPCGQIQVRYPIAPALGEREAIRGPGQILPLPAGLGRSCEAGQFHAGDDRGDAATEGRHEGEKQVAQVHGWRVVSSGSPGAERLRAGSNSRFRSPATGLKCTVTPSSPLASSWRPAMSFA